MIVVDCNVLVHLLIDGTKRRACALLEHDADWHSEGPAMVELPNVLATAMGKWARDAQMP